MNPWWWLLIVPGILLALVILLILGILFTKTAILLRYNEGGFVLRIRFLFIWFTRYPKKEKPKKKKKKKAKKPPVKKKPAESFNLQDEISQLPVNESFRDYLKMLTLIVSKFITKFRCEKLNVNLAIGGQDADTIAMNYGKINAAIYPIVGALAAADRLDQCNIQITPDFTSEEFRGEGEGVFSVRLYHAPECILEIAKTL